MQYFNSAAIRGASYNSATKVLTILFTSGGTYDYFGVPLSVYEGLVQASSKGSYFNAYIRDQYAA